jgi:hypothetical protein
MQLDISKSARTWQAFRTGTWMVMFVIIAPVAVLPNRDEVGASPPWGIGGQQVFGSSP